MSNALVRFKSSFWPSLHLLLIEAERAWAYSQELINNSLKSTNKDAASTLRHHATGRFRRSVHWSTQLLSHCQTLFASGRLSAENLLEATVYTLVLNGRFLRYRDDFEDALIQLAAARSLLDELATAATNSRDQALATLFSDDIGPEIRYCAHELGRAKAYDIDAIVQELAAEHRNELVDNCEQLIKTFKSDDYDTSDISRKRLETIVWEGGPLPIRNPELVDVFLKVQEAERKLVQQDPSAVPKGSKKGVAAYDAILLALSDAEEVARKLVEAQQVRSDAASHLFHILSSLVARILQQHRVLVIFNSFMPILFISYCLDAFNVISFS